jgi:hypothetical protein
MPSVFRRSCGFEVLVTAVLIGRDQGHRLWQLATSLPGESDLRTIRQHYTPRVIA